METPKHNKRCTCQIQPSPWKGTILKERILFQPSSFTGYVNFLGVYKHQTMIWKKKKRMPEQRYLNDTCPPKKTPNTQKMENFGNSKCWWVRSDDYFISRWITHLSATWEILPAITTSSSTISWVWLYSLLDRNSKTHIWFCAHFGETYSKILHQSLRKQTKGLVFWLPTKKSLGIPKRKREIRSFWRVSDGLSPHFCWNPCSPIFGQMLGIQLTCKVGPGSSCKRGEMGAHINGRK